MPCYRDGCWDRNQVNVCWHPRQVVRNTIIGRNPAGGYELTTIPGGRMICLQSTRNPECSSSPPVRPASPQGYYWAYYRNPDNGAVYTGWVLGSDIGGGLGGPCNGPAFEDFQCGQSPVGCTHSAGGCGDRDDLTTTNREGYIRFAPGSTAIHWVGTDANVRRTAYANNGYACVTVNSNGKFCPDGSIGWIEQSALR